VLSSNAHGASTVYRATFTTSSTGALADFTSRIYLAASAGTTFSSSPLSMFDLTTGDGLPGGYLFQSVGPSTVSLAGGDGVPAGHTIEVTIGATNPAAGSYQLQIWTDSDTVPVLTPVYAIS